MAAYGRSARPLAGIQDVRVHVTETQSEPNPDKVASYATHGTECDSWPRPDAGPWLPLPLAQLRRLGLEGRLVVPRAHFDAEHVTPPPRRPRPHLAVPNASTTTLTLTDLDLDLDSNGCIHLADLT